MYLLSRVRLHTLLFHLKPTRLSAPVTPDEQELCYQLLHSLSQGPTLLGELCQSVVYLCTVRPGLRG